MKVENIGVVPPAVNFVTRKLAESYPDPKNMIKEGDHIVKQGGGVLLAGIGGMLVGGSIDALSGTNREQVYGAGRMVWGAGAAIAIGGFARMVHGDTVQKGGKAIRTAVGRERAAYYD